MPRVKDFYHRIEIIDQCLRQRGKKWTITALHESVNKKLEERLEEGISKRTLQYALEYLINEKAAPIEKERDGKKVVYYYADVNYSIRNLPVNDEEIILLKDAVSVLRQVGNNALAPDLAAIISKLEHAATQSDVDGPSIIQFERQPVALGLEHIDNLFTAIKEQIALKVCYQPFDKAPVEWIIHPYLLKEYRNRWFVIGQNDTYQSIATLALDRIKNIKPTTTNYIENKLFDPVTYYENLIGVTYPADAIVEDVVLKVHPKQLPYVRTKPLHFSQELKSVHEDGSGVINLRVIDNYELRSLLLSYGPSIEILEPLTLRNVIRDLLDQNLNNYKELCK